MSILFINGSPNENGNTVKLAAKFLEGKEYETLHLADYRIFTYGQGFEDDEFNDVLVKIKEHDTIVIGSPLYWHSMAASVRILLERFYGYVREDAFAGKDLYFVFQGASPTQAQLEAGEYTMKRFSKLYGFNYKEMITQ